MVSLVSSLRSCLLRSRGTCARVRLKSREALTKKCCRVQRQFFTNPQEAAHPAAKDRNRLLVPSPYKMTSLQKKALGRRSFANKNQIIYIPPSEVKLPNQKTLSREEFENHPLFKITQEKQEVFSQLATMCGDSEALREYDHFLITLTLKDPEWHSYFKSHPIKLGYLSLLAFLEGKIDREELFIMHMVGEAYRELLSEKVSAVTIHTLSPDNAAKYLQEAGFPLFSPQPNIFKRFFRNLLKNLLSDELPDLLEFIYSKNIPLITHCKYNGQLKKEKREFLTELTQLSPVKRASVEYTLDRFYDDPQHLNHRLSVEMGIYFKDIKGIGYKNIEGGKGTIVLLSPQLIIDILRRTSAISSPAASEHVYTFGFSEVDEPFYQGVRVISIPSPLFSGKYVHGYRAGPEGLGIYYHDVLYHLPLEVNNPHIKPIVNIAKKIKSYAFAQKEFSQKQMAEDMANGLIDKEILDYSIYTPKVAFLNWFVYIIKGQYRQKIKKLGKDNHIKLVQEILPLIKKDLEEIDASLLSKIQKKLSKS